MRFRSYSFFLVFGRETPSPETISLELPPKPLPPDHYAKHIVSRMQDAHKQFSQIKADLLTLCHIHSGNNISHPVNIEKVVVIPKPEQHDLQPPDETVVENEIDSDSTGKVDKVPINADLTHVAHEFGKYLSSLPSKSSTVSQAPKFVYQQHSQSLEILSRHGRLKGLVKFCPFLHMDGKSSGGTYILSINQTLFKQSSDS